jgi:deazaflavin-dependent oxidoreductase (nitroreductase family)
LTRASAHRGQDAPGVFVDPVGGFDTSRDPNFPAQPAAGALKNAIALRLKAQDSDPQLAKAKAAAKTARRKADAAKGANDAAAEKLEEVANKAEAQLASETANNAALWNSANDAKAKAEDAVEKDAKARKTTEFTANNRVGLNRITRHVATRLPGFGVIVHRGRKTGRLYRTPVNVFVRRGGGYTVALTYGTDSEWLRNVLAAAGCSVETSGRRVELIRPRVVHDPARRRVPPLVRLVLGLLQVSDFLELDLDSMERGARNVQRDTETRAHADVME